jgi:hypothetical protein
MLEPCHTLVPPPAEDTVTVQFAATEKEPEFCGIFASEKV